MAEASPAGTVLENGIAGTAFCRQYAGMIACGCLNPIEITAALAGYGLLGIAALAIVTLCLVGVLLGGLALSVHLALRTAGRTAGEAEPTEGLAGLDSFSWEEPPRLTGEPGSGGARTR